MEVFRELSFNNVLGNFIRFVIMFYFLLRERVFFRDFLEVFEVIFGNLDLYFKIFEREGYVEVFKIIVDRLRIVVKIIDRGVEEMGKYLKVLKKVLEEIEG